MFIDALCFGLDPIPTDKKAKEFWINEYRTKGIEYISSKLKEKDFQVAQNNSIVALETIINNTEIALLPPFSGG